MIEVGSLLTKNYNLFNNFISNFFLVLIILYYFYTYICINFLFRFIVIFNLHLSEYFINLILYLSLSIIKKSVKNKILMKRK